jgi:hypothetical protein
LVASLHLPDGTALRARSDARFQALLEHCARTAEELACRPTIFTVTRSDAGAAGAVGAIEQTADADATRALASRTFVRDSITTQAIECQKQRVESHGTVDDDPRARVLRNDIFPLPASQQPAAQQMQRPRADLVELKQLYEQVACALLGVPRALIISDKSVRGHEEATNRSLTMRVQRWKHWLCDSAERTVEQMFARTIAKRAHANFRAIFGLLSHTTEHIAPLRGVASP